MHKVVFLTGAGMSAESGIRTFRDSGGLWEGYDVMTVASPEGWQRNPELVLDFYNARRSNMLASEPNDAHKRLANWQQELNIYVITQNIDDLHERGGSQHVLHLHGELSKCRSTGPGQELFDYSHDLQVGDCCPKGFQLRPHVVWFGEDVPEIPQAIDIISTAELVVVIGTSLQVYPAAGLIHYAPEGVPIALIDPGNHHSNDVFQHIQLNATEGLKVLEKELMKKGWLTTP